MDQSPITVETSETCITINAVNVFKINRELDDGSVATVLALRITVTELITFKPWESTRWLSMKPCDKFEDSLAAFVRFRDDFLYRVTQISNENEEATSEFISEARKALNDALQVSTATIRRIAHEEYLKGKQESNERKGVRPPGLL